MVEVLVVLLWLALQKITDIVLARLTKKKQISSFVAGKIMHLFVGVSVIPFAYLIEDWYIAAIPVTLILSGNAYANLSRVRESGKFQAGMFPLAAFLLPLVLILYLWKEKQTDVVVLSVLMMTFGDAAAAWGGIRYGTHRIGWTGKSLEGALFNLTAAFLVALWIGFVLYGMPLRSVAFAAAVTGASGAVAEAIVPGAWDNPVVLMVGIIGFGVLL